VDDDDGDTNTPHPSTFPTNSINMSRAPKQHSCKNRRGIIVVVVVFLIIIYYYTLKVFLLHLLSPKQLRLDTTLARILNQRRTALDAMIGIGMTESFSKLQCGLVGWR
jgi:hypothetical protein